MRQPQVANTYVPSLASRQNAPAAVQPLLNAFPLPNGPDLGNGTAAFSAGYSDPSSLDSYGIRMDYLPSSKGHGFWPVQRRSFRIGQRGAAPADELQPLQSIYKAPNPDPDTRKQSAAHPIDQRIPLQLQP